MITKANTHTHQRLKYSVNSKLILAVEKKATSHLPSIRLPFTGIDFPVSPLVCQVSINIICTSFHKFNFLTRVKFRSLTKVFLRYLTFCDTFQQFTPPTINQRAENERERETEEKELKPPPHVQQLHDEI